MLVGGLAKVAKSLSVRTTASTTVSVISCLLMQQQMKHISAVVTLAGRGCCVTRSIAIMAFLLMVGSANAKRVGQAASVIARSVNMVNLNGCLCFTQTMGPKSVLINAGLPMELWEKREFANVSSHGEVPVATDRGVQTRIYNMWVKNAAALTPERVLWTPSLAKQVASARHSVKVSHVKLNSLRHLHRFVVPNATQVQMLPAALKKRQWMMSSHHKQFEDINCA